MNRPLSVGIEVASNSLVVGLVDANGAKLGTAKTSRKTLPAAAQRVTDLIAEAFPHSADPRFCARKATGFYDWHLLESLAESAFLLADQPKRYRLSPRTVKAFTAVSSQTDQTDRNDAFFIANYLRFTQPQHPFNVQMDSLPHWRLTRLKKTPKRANYCREELFSQSLVPQVFGVSSGKAVCIGLWGNELCLYGGILLTGRSIMTDMEQLLAFVIAHGKNRFHNPEEVVRKLAQVARESYRLRPTLAKSVNWVLATSLANIRALGKSLAEIN